MKKTDTITKTGILAAIYGVSAFLTVPFPGVPLTFQCFAIALGAYCFGAGAGVSATAVYVALGAAGLPLFSAFRGGIQVLVGPTGGFIWGFFFLSLLCGLARGKSKYKALAFGLMGLAMCYCFGVVWYSRSAGVGLWAAFLTGSIWYLIKDIFLTVAAYFLSLTVQKALLTEA